MDFTEEYKRWDEFLAKWPLEKLEQMTLEEYTNAGSRESFTYWIEAKLENLGSIWGGSAFKFGVYARKNTEPKENNNRVTYSDTHGWYTMLGNSVEEAFAKVKSYVIQVATYARTGQLEQIDRIKELGDAYKWKIAFHYQNRQSPSIIDVFTEAALRNFAHITEVNIPLSGLQKAVMLKKPQDMGILEFGKLVWNTWRSSKLTIWKLNYGKTDYTNADINQYLHNQIASIAANTTKGQNRNFESPETNNAFFYLCHSNEKMLLLGQFTSEVKLVNGWLERKYRVIKQATHNDYYKGSTYRGWTPNYNSTFMQVKPEELQLFEQEILKPFFEMTLQELAEETENYKTLTKESTDAVTITKTSSSTPCTDTENTIYYGPPGTGKTHKLMELMEAYKDDADNLRYKTVTFHQSYGYEEFIEGLRPVLKKENNNHDIQYEIKEGIFKELCDKAKQNPNKRYAIFIDEINRGNISKIFGELISLIELDKRERLEVILPYSQELFTVPANIDIIGAMNTADHSLTRLDTALRRRFAFKPLYPDLDYLSGTIIIKDNISIDLQKIIAAINRRIELLYDKEHCIGHAYFKDIVKKPDMLDENKFCLLQNIFQHKIIPLLEEYFFEDWQKIRLVLADNQKQDIALQFIQQNEVNTLNLFGEADIVTTEYRYTINKKAFDNPEAYQAIYMGLYD